MFSFPNVILLLILLYIYIYYMHYIYIYSIYLFYFYFLRRFWLLIAHRGGLFLFASPGDFSLKHRQVLVGLAQMRNLLPPKGVL